LTLLVGRQEGHPACKNEWWGAGVVICLELGADLLTWVVLDKGPLNGVCVCACACVRACVCAHINIYHCTAYGTESFCA